MYKLFTMKCTEKQMMGIINHQDSPYAGGSRPLASQSLALLNVVFFFGILTACVSSYSVRPKCMLH
jgi:hypothetical protein